MNPQEFWQNFKLGEEQEIACNFIYDGLRNLDEMETLSLESEVFPVLYNLSVGIERLLKVAVTLLEFDDNTDVNSFEESLITHNHLDLLNRIKKKTSLSLGDVHIELLSLLVVFYKTHRYDRFNFQSIRNLSKDKKILHDFLHKYLKIDVTEDFPLTCVWNSPRIKKFIGKTVKSISKELYGVITRAAETKNLYTYEISGSSSKAAKVLWGDEPITFEDKQISIIEILIFFMNTKESSLIRFIKSIEPLSLDPALSSSYLQLLLHDRTPYSSMVMEEIEARHNDGVADLKQRLEVIKAITDPNVMFGDEN